METFIDQVHLADRERLKSLIQQHHDFELNTRNQLDRSMRDLESTDIKMQQEINDMNDRNREQVIIIENFKQWVAEELKKEFIKINNNFEAQQQDFLGREQRTQGEIERLKD